MGRCDRPAIPFTLPHSARRYSFSPAGRCVALPARVPLRATSAACARRIAKRGGHDPRRHLLFFTFLRAQHNVSPVRRLTDAFPPPCYPLTIPLKALPGNGITGGRGART